MNRPPTVASVDLARFSGDWYVIAHIPARVERHACNAVESYTLQDDGTIQIRYRYTVGTPDGPRKLFRARAFVHDQASRAEWRVQPFWPFAWPIRLPYLVTYLDADYRTTIIGYPKWKYLWIMTRTPEVTEQEYGDLIALAQKQGYDPSRIRRVPQLWSTLPSADGG